MVLNYSMLVKHARAFAIASVCILNVLLSADAVAAQEEIQVYMDEFTEPGEFGLDLHTNYVASGNQDAGAFDQPTVHQFRVTPEFSYGLSQHWDMAAYFLTVRNPGGLLQTDGVKLRAKWRPEAPSAASSFYWAVNFEVGQLARQYFEDVTSGQIKLIGVWTADPWKLGVNYNVDRAVRSHPMQAATSELDGKIAYQIRDGLQVGIENYSFFGAFHYDPAQPQGSHANYLVADFSLGKWDFNAGIGYTSGQSPDKTVLKAIITVPI